MTTLPWSRPLTAADLEAMPDDGHRYELLDGTLLVTPAPRFEHQLAVGRLHLKLAAVIPDELVALMAPFDVRLADDTVLQPDLFVAHRGDFTPRNLPVAPVLAVEVQSPTTRRVDLLLKRDRFQAAGCAAYWVVDPEEPSVIAWQLQGGSYVETARASGDGLFAVEQPIRLAFRPSDLVR